MDSGAEIEARLWIGSGANFRDEIGAKLGIGMITDSGVEIGVIFGVTLEVDVGLAFNVGVGADSGSAQPIIVVARNTIAIMIARRMEKKTMPAVRG